MANEATQPDAELTADTVQPKSLLRRRVIRVLCWSALVVLVLYGLSNLWLWSSWGACMVAAELNKRSGQNWEIASAS